MCILELLQFLLHSLTTDKYPLYSRSLSGLGSFHGHVVSECLEIFFYSLGKHSLKIDNFLVQKVTLKIGFRNDDEKKKEKVHNYFSYFKVDIKM